MREGVATWDREQFLTVTLGKKRKVIAIDRVSVGSLTASIVLPREVFEVIVPANVAAFIYLQNHASGDPTPSKEACLPKLWPRQSLPAQSHLSHA